MLYDGFQALAVPRFTIPFGVYSTIERWYAANKRLGNAVDDEDGGTVDDRTYEVESLVAEIFPVDSKEYKRAVKDAKKQVDALLAFVNRW